MKTASRTTRKASTDEVSLALRICLVVFLAMVASIGQADDRVPEAELGRTFAEEVEVVEVQVPVNVVRRDGWPMRDLTAEDFVLRDNGVRQEILDVEMIDLEKIELGTVRSRIERAVPAVARRRFLIVFDISFSRPSSILKAREAAKKFVLNELHPTDLAAVAVVSADADPRLVLTFTPDRAQLARAIDTLGYTPLLGATRWDPLRFVIDAPGAGGVAGEVGGEMGALGSPDAAILAYLGIAAQQVARMDRSYRLGRVEDWTDGLESLARALHQVSGRKHILFFSEGFDGSLLVGSEGPMVRPNDLSGILRGTGASPGSDYGSMSLHNQMRRMLEEFRRADCVIHVVDISGLEAAESRGEAQRSRQEALFFISNETGGEFFEDANDFGGELRKVLQRTSVTYVLRYQPSLVPDGSYHRIEVRADVPKGTDISHRVGYYAPRPYGSLHPFERSLLAADEVAGLSRREEVLIDVLAVPFPAGGEASYVPVILEVSGDGLLQGHAETRLPIELYAYVTDGRGEMKDFFTQTVTLELSDRDAFARTGLKYYGHLELSRPGEYLLRVLVRNAATGRTGVRVADLEVPEAIPGRPRALLPLFVDSGLGWPRSPASRADWVMVREAPPKASDPQSLVYPYTAKGEPYVPSARPAVHPSQPALLCLVAYGLHPGEIVLDGTVVNSSGEVVATGLVELLERTITGLSGTDKILARFTVEHLEPGEYSLRVSLSQDDGTNVLSVSSDFLLVR